MYFLAKGIACGNSHQKRFPPRFIGCRTPLFVTADPLPLLSCSKCLRRSSSLSSSASEDTGRLCFFTGLLGEESESEPGILTAVVAVTDSAAIGKVWRDKRVASSLGNSGGPDSGDRLDFAIAGRFPLLGLASDSGSVAESSDFSWDTFCRGGGAWRGGHC